MKRSLSRRISNRVLHLLARFLPGATGVRPLLHRLRGVKVGKNVFIGDDVYLENEHPEAVEIQTGVQISVRAIILAHTRGSGRIVIEKDAFIGPNTVIATSGDRTLRIGEGAVIGAGVVVTNDVPAHVFVASAAATPVANARVPLTRAEKMDDFVRGLAPLGRRPKEGTSAAVAAVSTTTPSSRS
jgi:acetyltransferase-like isoleucine patch superfamily enzyme